MDKELKKIDDRLRQICQQLKDTVSDLNAQISIAVETGEDECALIGTIDGYVNFAREILEGVSIGLLKIDDEELRVIRGFVWAPAGKTIQSTSDVGFASLMLARSEQEAREIRQRFLDQTG